MSDIRLDLEKILKFLVDDNIVPDQSLNDKALIDAINRGSDLVYDELTDELFFLDDKGEKILAPDLSSGISTSSDGLVDHLPSVMIDIDQGGNVRRSIESESCYKLSWLAVVIPSYKEEIIEKFYKYGFELMSFKEKLEDFSLSLYVQEFQALDSDRINSIFLSYLF